MHCHTTGLGAQCAHPEPRSRAHCERSAHVVGAAARTASLSRSCRACTCRDTPRQPAPRSRPHFDVVTPRQPESRSGWCHFDVVTPTRPLHVATSDRCRDTTQANPCRDIKSVSRHRFSCPAQARSRHQDQVATFLETNLCRDINFMSRPRF